ncbi:MAG TPA: class D sortase [Anaerolineales bacterium]|nr:class D sortase [Anaerolineales bacterium]
MPSRRNRRPEDLSVRELRRLLIEKSRAARQERLHRFRQTGRVVTLVADGDPTGLESGLESLRTTPLIEEAEPVRVGPSVSRRIADGLLLFVELAAVGILLFVTFVGLDLWRKVNQEYTQSLIQPTLTSTPLVIAAVLPSGHTPPDALGGAQPNEAEIPEHLRPLYQSLASIPIPTPAPEQAVRIQIPAIGVDAPIVQGDGWEQLKKGVGQNIGSANPGQKGNLVLSAHNDIFGEIFRYLDQLKTGDVVIVYSNQRSYTYVITGTKIVEPTQVEVMAPTSDATTTLISCYPYRVDDKRIVVTAKLQDS